MVKRWVPVAACVVLVGVLVVPIVVGSVGTIASQQDGPIPVLESASRPPGTTLGNGFSVAAGTSLIGDVFPNPVINPYRGEPIVDRGWHAFLLVEGDPRSVMAAYAEQAKAVGAELSSGPTLCDYQSAGKLLLYGCAASGAIDSTEPRSIQFELLRGETQYGPVSHLLITYNDPGTNQLAAGYRSVPIAQASPGPNPPSVPKHWPALAVPGDFAFGDSATGPGGFGASPFTVEPGSTVAAPVGPAGINTGLYDWSIVLHVTGDPRDVADAYRKQLASHGRFGRVSDALDVSHPQPNTTVYRFDAESLGDADHHFEILHRANSEWMLVHAYAQT